MFDRNFLNGMKPEWAPKNAGSEFAAYVMEGVGHKGTASVVPAKRRQLTAQDYIQGILAGDRTILARAITLIESNSAQHITQAQEVLQALLPHTGNSIRVGITGVPGAGKSTTIENLGLRLCAKGHKLAVLAVDPSSTVTGGSILGDKTRMEQLSRHPNAFIRPTPSGGALGGVARKTRETVLLCEAFGFDVLILETVGVGQSEIAVRSMVDCFLLLMIAGAGDELQGIKKGVIEIADAIIVNKADGDNERRARLAKAEYNRVLHFLQPATQGWQTKALTCSAITGAGVETLWQTVLEFMEHVRSTGIFTERRQQQNVAWLKSMLEEGVLNHFFSHPEVAARLPQLQAAVAAGKAPVTAVARELLQQFTSK